MILIAKHELDDGRAICLPVMCQKKGPFSKAFSCHRSIDLSSKLLRQFRLGIPLRHIRNQNHLLDLARLTRRIEFLEAHRAQLVHRLHGRNRDASPYWRF